MAKSCFLMYKHNLKTLIPILAAVLLTFSGVLCSCGSSGGKESITLQTVFCKKFSAEYDGTEFSGKVDCAEGEITFTLDSPDTLKNTKIIVNTADKSMTADVYGMKIKLDSQKYPSAAFAAAFADAVCGAAKSGNLSALNGKLSGESNDLKYEITANDDGEINEILFENIPLKITLSPC